MVRVPAAAVVVGDPPNKPPKKDEAAPAFSGVAGGVAAVDIECKAVFVFEYFCIVYSIYGKAGATGGRECVSANPYVEYTVKVSTSFGTSDQSSRSQKAHLLFHCVSFFLNAT